MMEFNTELSAWQASTVSTYDSIVALMDSGVKQCWEDAKIEVYGSYSLQLHNPFSDIDLVVTKMPTDLGIVEILMIFKEQLSKNPAFRDFTEIYFAAMPLLRLTVEHN
jgi:poly(A) polymerase Pap1